MGQLRKNGDPYVNCSSCRGVQKDKQYYCSICCDGERVNNNLRKKYPIIHHSPPICEICAHYISCTICDGQLYTSDMSRQILIYNNRDNRVYSTPDHVCIICTTNGADLTRLECMRRERLKFMREVNPELPIELVDIIASYCEPPDLGDVSVRVEKIFKTHYTFRGKIFEELDGITVNRYVCAPSQEREPFRHDLRRSSKLITDVHPQFLDEEYRYEYNGLNDDDTLSQIGQGKYIMDRIWVRVIPLSIKEGVRYEYNCGDWWIEGPENMLR